MGEISDLPDEILTGILVRFPPKFLGRCKCVSKRWNNLISHPQFIKTNFSLNTRNKVLYLTGGQEESLAIVDAADSSVSFPKLKIHSWCCIFGTCNGLVLALNEELKLFLLNPTTRVYKNVPTLPEINVDPYGQWGATRKGATIGLGYDSITDDYKVVTIINDSRAVFVYTFKSGIWKRIDQDCPFNPLAEMKYLQSCRVFLNASIHWLHYDPDSFKPVITAFDLTTEEFWEVPPPRGVKFLGIKYASYLGVVGGCLCLFYNDGEWWGKIPFTFFIWVMKEYGVEESWTKFLVNLNDETLPLVVPQEGFVGDHLEELVFIDKWYDVECMYKADVWSYDANKGTWRRVVSFDRVWQIYGCTFAESLISP